ncbi:hypothetical protein [Blautia phage Montmirail]|nr:hypothetical protein [Blautia phage Montmirail]
MSFVRIYFSTIFPGIAFNFYRHWTTARRFFTAFTFICHKITFSFVVRHKKSISWRV